MTQLATGDSEIRHGTKIGRFVVIGELGAGGMGVVYAAHDPQLDRQVALKVLRESNATEEDRMRLLREGQAMARITHPNVITVFEVGTEGNMVFLAQELLDGGTLRGWLEKPHEQAEILDKLVAAGRGLAAAHAAGLVHRDFKPENVLLGKDGRVRVADFGLARALGAAEQLAVTRRNGPGDGGHEASTMNPMAQLTRTGAVMGTPMFMSPEQHDGKPADARSDQFSFCIALYNALYGDWPYDGKTSVALADAVIAGRRKAVPSGKNVASRIRRAIDRGLATDPGGRFPSMDALLAELVAPPAGVRPVWIAAGAVVVLGGVAAAAAIAMSSSSSNKPVPITSSPADAMVEKPIDAAPGSAAPDPKLASDRGANELIDALESARLDGAIASYLALARDRTNAGDKLGASIASSIASFAQAQRGKLTEAKRLLEDATTANNVDPLARAYADLAAANLALMQGQLEVAIDRGGKCADGFAKTIKPLASACQLIVGEALFEQDNPMRARKAYESARDLVPEDTHHHDLAQLGLIQLEQDVTKRIDGATRILTAAMERVDLGLAAHARIVRASAHLANDDNSGAYDLLQTIKTDSLHAIRLRLPHQFLHSQASALKDGDLVSQLIEIDKARTEAASAQLPGLELAASLARIEAQIGRGEAPDPPNLDEEAAKRGYHRIAKLAKSVLEQAARDP